MTTLSRETRVASGRLKTVWRSSRLGARYLVEGTRALPFYKSFHSCRSPLKSVSASGVTSKGSPRAKVRSRMARPTRRLTRSRRGRQRIGWTYVNWRLPTWVVGALLARSHIERTRPSEGPPPMSKSSSFTDLKDLSAALAGLVTGTATSLVSVCSGRSRSSGVVWRSGLLVTADEALSEDSELTVKLWNGDAVAAQAVGRDPSTDIALLRIDRSDLQPISLAASAGQCRCAGHSRRR